MHQNSVITGPRYKAGEGLILPNLAPIYSYIVIVDQISQWG